MEEVPLTPQQIQSILSAVPDPPGAGKTAKKVAKQHHINTLREILTSIKLVPLGDAFDEFKREIIKSSYQALIEPSTAVGVAAGVALGRPITQLSLNSFHYAGTQSGVAIAFQKIRDFLTGSKRNRVPQMRIYFKVPGTGLNLHDVLHEGTFESIMSRRFEFEQTTVQDVVQDSEILTHQEAIDAGLLQMLNIHAKLRPRRFRDLSSQFPLSSVIELRLNSYRMFTHRITMQMLAEAIEGPNDNDVVTCVWVSQRDARMYILLDETKNYGQDIMPQDDAVLVFLRRLPANFSKWNIGGISGIISIEPKEVQIRTGIHRIIRSTTRPNQHRVTMTNRTTRWEGISLADMKRMFEKAGFHVTNVDTENLHLQVEYDGDLEEELDRRIREVQAVEVPQRTPQQNEFISALSYHYILTEGSHYKKLIWRDDLDLYRTVDLSAHEIQDSIGIDAARVFLIFKFRQAVEEFSAYINGRHIALIFDLLTNLGMINSLTYTGVNRQGIKPLALASYERPLDVMVNAATFGEREILTGVSASIYTGQKAKRVGTGATVIKSDVLAETHDRPTMPSIDEASDLSQIELSEPAFSFADLLAGKELPTLVPSQEPVNKARILERSTIRETGPDVDPSLIPSGIEVVMASQPLVSALNKLAIGSNVSFEPRPQSQVEDPRDTVLDMGDVPDITELTSFDDLELVSPTRGQPAPPPPRSNILGELKRLPTGQSTTSDLFNQRLPTPEPLEREAPRPPPVVISKQPPPPAEVSYPPPEPVAFDIVPAIPVLEAPPFPQVTEAVEITIPAIDQPEVTTEGSFLDFLPDISEMEVEGRLQGTVQPISVQEFMQSYPTGVPKPG